MNSIPEQKQDLIDQLVRQLSAISNMEAIVVGGSVARGTARPDSDVDLGLYYFQDRPFAIEVVRRIAESVSVGRAPTVTDFYQWGAWVNGGAWIWTATGKVDFLYRNIDHVRRVISEAHAGKHSLDYEQQPPYGFQSVIYLAETHVCVPLYDPSGIIGELKQSVAEYPPTLKQRIIGDSLWSTQFTLAHADKFASRGDAYNAVGCFTRAAANLTQALYALNEQYFISDKGAMEAIAGFSLHPTDYPARLEAILARPGQTAQELTASVAQIKGLFNEVAALAGELYRERYSL